MILNSKKFLLLILLLIIIGAAYFYFSHRNKASNVSITLTKPVGLVFFGDSLSDMGNASNAPYTSTGGKVWVSYFAENLETAVSPSNQGGNDWAVAGDETGTSPYQTNDDGGVVGQVTRYLQQHNQQADARTIYIIWAGANDFLHYFARNASFSPPDSVYENAVNNLQSSIERLHTAGAARIIVLNLPPLGFTPFGNKPFLQDKLNNITEKFNQDLQTKIKALGYSISLINAAADLEKLYKAPGKFGFTDITQICQNAPHCNPETWFFWDQIHPTDGGHRAIARQIGQYFKH